MSRAARSPAPAAPRSPAGRPLAAAAACGPTPVASAARARTPDDAACCGPVLAAPFDAATAERLAATLKVLADPARLRLLGLIKAQPGSEACVCNLTSALRLTQPTVTHHLQVLHRAGFLARERRGVWVWYRVVPSALGAVRRALA